MPRSQYRQQAYCFKFNYNLYNLTYCLTVTPGWQPLSYSMLMLQHELQVSNRCSGSNQYCTPVPPSTSFIELLVEL